MNRYDFPHPLKRVTAGHGGEAVLIIGKEKTVLHDCGMACFHKGLLKNIEDALDGRTLDYVILSHTHYDHMGALPYIIEKFPEVKVCGGAKTAQVFTRQGAINTIVSMGKSAAEFYGCDPDEVHANGLRVDIVLDDCDVLEIGGDEKILALETKGHTDCSMTYCLQPYGIIFTSESTGVLESENVMHTSVLKSFDDCLEAAKVLKMTPYKHIIVPHYGLCPKEKVETFFDWFIEEAIKEKTIIEDCIAKGMTAEEIFEEHKKVYWNEVRAVNHPYRAYKMNTDIIIKRMMD